jgi:hypothetical protein
MADPGSNVPGPGYGLSALSDVVREKISERPDVSSRRTSGHADAVPHMRSGGPPARRCKSLVTNAPGTYNVADARLIAYGDRRATLDHHLDAQQMHTRLKSRVLVCPSEPWCRPIEAALSHRRNKRGWRKIKVIIYEQHLVYH